MAIDSINQSCTHPTFFPKETLTIQVTNTAVSMRMDVDIDLGMDTPSNVPYLVTRCRQYCATRSSLGSRDGRPNFYLEAWLSLKWCIFVAHPATVLSTIVHTARA